MADWIRTNGQIIVVQPENGEFTNEEMHRYVPGSMHALRLTSRLFMYHDDNYVEKGLPENRAAFATIRRYRPDWRYMIQGDVLIASTEETGDDD